MSTKNQTFKSQKFFLIILWFYITMNSMWLIFHYKTRHYILTITYI